MHFKENQILNSRIRFWNCIVYKNELLGKCISDKMHFVKYNSHLKVQIKNTTLYIYMYMLFFLHHRINQLSPQALELLLLTQLHSVCIDDLGGSGGSIVWSSPAKGQFGKDPHKVFVLVIDCWCFHVLIKQTIFANNTRRVDFQSRVIVSL